jgi:hypothetical protein
MKKAMGTVDKMCNNDDIKLDWDDNHLVSMS